jgi:excisionase family DNA binding protein
MTKPPRVGRSRAQPPEWTVREYAQVERVTQRTVWTWIAKGALTIRRTPGGRVRIPQGDEFDEK